jgi:hypothetical protein
VRHGLSWDYYRQSTRAVDQYLNAVDWLEAKCKLTIRYRALATFTGSTCVPVIKDHILESRITDRCEPSI